MMAFGTRWTFAQAFAFGPRNTYDIVSLSPSREDIDHQPSSEASFEKYRKPTRREEFLAQMDTVMPWGKLTALIEPVYPQGDGAVRPPVGLERMLRVNRDSESCGAPLSEGAARSTMISSA
jgi:hypothetical protein